MQLIKSEIKNGSVYVTMNVSPEELAEAASPQRAAQEAIKVFTDEKNIESLMFTRVTAMDREADGSMTIVFDAAIAPEVKLGQYRGLAVRVGHNEDFEEAALNAAAENIKVELPDVVIERKIDAMIVETQMQIMNSVSLNTLADVHAILTELCGTLGMEETEEEIWRDAKAISEDYINKGSQDIEMFVDSIAEISGADSGSVEDAVNARISQRGRMSGDEIGRQIFEAYLRSENTGNEEWRASVRDSAAARCRVDFLLKAVADAEAFEVEDAEYEKAVYELANQYDVGPKDIVGLVGEEAIKNQIRISKARNLIVDSASGK
ncbi:MAG: hypothetical protein ACOX68_05760 [Candidatus Limivicinus sp.]|jgi:FKBP-type peptidyl-prolyl cis-trans isomerase (trigger factor)